MSRKYKSIEFFGIPGSGKTYISLIVKIMLEKKGYTVLDARKCITYGAQKYLKTNLVEKFCLNYFKLINFKNKKNIKLKVNLNVKKKNLDKLIDKKKFKANYLKQIYINICKKIINKNKKFNLIIKEIETNFQLDLKKNQHYLFWIYELIASHIIFNNIYKSKNYVLLLDEGLIQRSFLIDNKIQKIKKKKFFDLYFSYFPLSKLVFFVSNSKKKILSTNSLRKKSQIQKYKNVNDIKKNLIFFNNYIKTNKKLSFKQIKNNKNLQKTLMRFFI